MEKQNSVKFSADLNFNKSLCRNTKLSDNRSVYDSLYKLINFDEFYFQFIDTPQFQRLRELHQLGSNYFVFPSANHTRFEHGLGVGHLCKEYLNVLKNHQENLEIKESLEKSVIIAGLCHNIGHAPYSYPFTDFIHETLKISTWDSQEMTLNLIEDIIDSNSIDLNKFETNLIKDLIIGEKRYSTSNDEEFPIWSLQILNNRINGIDIDKFDFIRRDTYKLGFPNSFDADILINSARVIDNNICYREKDAFSIYEFFQCRYKMFKEFYLHRVSKGIDLMIKDVFSEANLHYNFTNYLQDPKLFIRLNDSILSDILHSNKKDLTSAKEIVKRIYKRDLYKFVGEKTCISSTSQNYEKFLNLSEEELLNYSSSDELYQEEILQRGDIKIMKCQLDFCKGEDDPVKFVKFYSSEKGKNEYEMKSIDRCDISLLTPSHYKEFIFRVYVKDANKLNAAKNAFSKFCNERMGESPHQYEKKSAMKYENKTI